MTNGSPPAESPNSTVDEASFDAPPLEDVLVPTDGSDTIYDGVDLIRPIVACCDATVHALYVLQDDFGATQRDHLRFDPKADAEETIERFERELAQRGMTTTATVRPGVPDEEIRTYAEENDIDLIVMVTHTRSGLSRVLRRSVTESVIRNSDVPVMAIRG